MTRLEAARQALLDELKRARDVQGRPRQFANYPAERARRAVKARTRDAIRILESVLPDLGSHLERSVVTGAYWAYCRYRPDDRTIWEVDSTAGDGSMLPLT